MTIPTDPNRRRHLLIEGLVGPHHHAYLHSATFHAAIDTLVGLLPLMVDGLASHAGGFELGLNDLLRQVVDPCPGLDAGLRLVDEEAPSGDD